MMHYKGCRGCYAYDEEAAILHGFVVGIKDVVTYQGRSIDDIKQSFKDSVDDYILFCKERGEEPDEPM